MSGPGRGVTQPKPSASGSVSGVQPSGRQHIYLRASITGSTCELMPRSVNKNVIHGLQPSHNFRFRFCPQISAVLTVWAPIHVAQIPSTYLPITPKRTHAPKRLSASRAPFRHTAAHETQHRSEAAATRSSRDGRREGPLRRAVASLEPRECETPAIQRP